MGRDYIIKVKDLTPELLLIRRWGFFFEERE
jgi:hypothetical protein